MLSIRHLCPSTLLGAALCGLGGTLGCRSDTTGPPLLDPVHLYFQLTLNHHAITMALIPPYDTLTLVATPRSATGAPLATAGPTTTYQVSDTSVTISPLGVLKAIAPDPGVTIIAARTIGNVTQTDTATVIVNDVSSPVPVFTTFTFQTQPGDSAKVYERGSAVSGPGFLADDSLQNVPGLIVNVLDTDGNPIPNVAFLVSAPQDPNPISLCTSANIFYSFLGFCPLVNLVQRERVWITAEATVYGVRKVDSLQYSVGWPATDVVYVSPRTPPGSVTPIGYFGPSDDTVAVGATVVWVNAMHGQQADVVFDEPAAVQGVDSTQFANGYFMGQYIVPSEGGGNIAAFAADSDTVTVVPGALTCLLSNCSPMTDTVLVVHARRFPTAGTYRYHSALYSTTGVLHVLPAFQFP